MKMQQLAASERPREKLQRDGPESLSTVEVLAIILGTGTRAKSVMELAGEVLALDERGLRYLAECSPEETSVSDITSTSFIIVHKKHKTGSRSNRSLFLP